MAFGEVVFVAEDGDVLAYEAVRDSSPAVNVGALHDDGVLYLGISNSGVVSDAGVGADEGVGSDLAMIAYDDGASYGCPSVND